MVTIRFERERGQAVDEIQWQPQELVIRERPNGPAAAAILSACLGALVLGLLTLFSEASTDVRDLLDIDSSVGPLSGKTAFAVIAYLASWSLFASFLWKRNVPWKSIGQITVILLALAFLFTCPTFFQLFEPD